jgi:hypothetical protein
MLLAETTILGELVGSLDLVERPASMVGLGLLSPPAPN